MSSDNVIYKDGETLAKHELYRCAYGTCVHRCVSRSTRTVLAAGESC